VDLIADTTLLVGIWRKQRWALDFARANEGRVIGLPWIVLGEFWHGATRAGHEITTVESFLEIGIPLMDPKPVIPIYAGMCTRLQEENAASYSAIGQNDLWIAATALYFDKPLVTRNRRHFEAIAGLRVLIPDDAKRR
jgi:predicted nucleic acid-binding protein